MFAEAADRFSVTESPFFRLRDLSVNAVRSRDPTDFGRESAKQSVLRVIA